MAGNFSHTIQFIMVFGSFFTGMVLLEAWYWRRRGVSGIYDFKESVANISSGVMYKLTNGVAVVFFVLVIYDWVAQFGLGLHWGHSWWMALALFFITDFVFWIFHIILHKVRWCWSSHVIHHSSLNFNLSTALRQNFIVDLTGTAMLWWLPLALLGFDKTAALVAIELNLVYQFFIHTQAVQKMPRWFEAVFNTPSHHRVHHGSNPLQIDRNFGGVLIVWDKIFGTFISEENAGKIVYGIGPRQPTTFNPIVLSLAEFFAMWRDAWHFKDVRVFWKHPNWIEERRDSSRKGGL
ncbi:MAG: sterol desaturase family protein [Formosimonas sp.]